MKYDMTKWLSELMTASVKKPLPILTFPAVQLMGVNVRELVTSSDLQTKAMVRIAQEVDSAAAVSFMDLSVEAESFGATVRYSDTEVPTVTGSLVTDEDEADALEIPPVGAGRTGLYLNAVESAADIISDRPVFAGCIGPFSLAGRLLDVSEALALCYEEPELVHKVLAKAAAFIKAYLKEYKSRGANGVIMAEPLTGLLPPALAWEFSGEYISEITAEVQDDSFIVIYHNCGPNAMLMADDIVRTGAKAFHFGNAIPLDEMLAKIPSDLPVFGNVDPASVIRGGTPDSVREATLSVLSKCSGYPNFVLSTGCDIPPTAPWENIKAFFAASDEFYCDK